MDGIAPRARRRLALLGGGSRPTHCRHTWLHLIEKLPNPQTEAERHGYVSNLFVVPELRGRGTGAALLEACLAACRADSCDAVVLWPTRESRSLYARHGFAVRDDLMELRPVR